ncbi:hypothetical protein VO01_10370 [Clavibacter michiganensis subsp. insidiosus]|uniref:Sortase n=1 Tax=Clavibacter michiganensis subsp. insidiosus TaxID=33014 RepID=A0A0D5CJP9_9MICO|nr:hypothetical protein VO01_10370 [Clavibacter michiganensis subsp. insidiosus]AWF97764.1 hypothetical protein BEH61_04520 [Clavibacter michiganensis subsp. insidiosus]
MCVASVLAGTALAAPASASARTVDPASASIELVSGSLANVERSDPTLLHEPSASSIGEMRAGTEAVTIPTDLSDGITVTDGNGDRLRVDLPGADAAAAPVVLDEGTVVFPGQASANSVIVSDVGVQMLTPVADAHAPSTYSYDVSLQPGQELALIGEGAAVLDADGSAALLIGQAWAMDADGDAVPTRYSVEGATLTQHVDRTSTHDVAYPVVADPVWFAPAVLRCLAGIGLNGPQIANIIATGTPGSLPSALGRAALACIRGK